MVMPGGCDQRDESSDYLAKSLLLIRTWEVLERLHGDWTSLSAEDERRLTDVSNLFHQAESYLGFAGGTPFTGGISQNSEAYDIVKHATVTSSLSGPTTEFLEALRAHIATLNSIIVGQRPLPDKISGVWHFCQELGLNLQALANPQRCI